MKAAIVFFVLVAASCDRPHASRNDSAKAAPFVPPAAPGAPARIGKGGCAVGTHRCSGEKLEACDQDKGWIEVNVCMSAAHCNAAMQQCLVDPCVLGETQCDGRKLQQCNANGWKDIQDCKKPELCDGLGGKCNPE